MWGLLSPEKSAKESNRLDPTSESILSREQLVREIAAKLEQAEVYFGHGTGNAIDEAVWLVLVAVGVSPVEPEPDFSLPVSSAAREQAYAWLEQRVTTRKPLAYLLNSAWFCGLEFYVDERVLVPRSPIAELIQQHFAPWLSGLQRGPEYILDLCTGSACIAIACAQAFPDAQIVASDISAEALSVAEQNVQRYQLASRLSLQQADVFSGLRPRTPAFPGYDIIVSNPPYVDAQDISSMPEEFRQEPLLGLAAGQDGLDIVRRILQEAGHYVSQNGILIVEVGNSEAAVIAQYPQLPFIWLEFEFGGQGVFLLQARDLLAYQKSLPEMPG